MFMVMVLMTFMSLGVWAVEYNEDGYSLATIYIQNNLDPYYDDFFDFAVDAWNDAGVIDRSIVVNTSSTSEIYDVNFDDDPNYTTEQYFKVLGFYEVMTTYPVRCSCHTASGFRIVINDFFVRDPVAANFGDQLTDNGVKGTIVHELGHAFGLVDFDTSENIQNSIMSYAVDYDQIYTPQTRDVNNANDCWAPHR